MIPSFLHSASLPLAQPFTDHTEHAFCSAKKVNQENLVLHDLAVCAMVGTVLKDLQEMGDFARV
jgi:hypothetical protein